MNISNGSAWDSSDSSLDFVPVIVAFQIIIIIAAVAGNLLVCAAICLNETLRKTAANYFIFSLAVSDILTATLSMPFDVEQYLKNWRWDHGPFICNLWTTVYLITVPTSILSLLAVSIDRYKAISDPLNKFRRSRFMTRKRAAFVVAGLWTYSIVFALIPKMGWSLPPEQVDIENQCVFDTPIEYSALNSCMNFYLPLFVMLVIYFRIYVIANKMNSVLDERTRQSFRGNHSNASENSGVHLSSTRAPSASTSSINGGGKLLTHANKSPDICHIKTIKRQRKKLTRSIKTAKSILIIVCAFFFCWIPYTTISVVGLFCKSCYGAIPSGVYSFLLVMGYLNSALNPPLYSFHNPKFKEAFRKILRFKREPVHTAINSSYSAPSDGGSKKSSHMFHSSRRSTGLLIRQKNEVKV